MSSSAYFKITTITEYEKPTSELEYFLFSYWDVWSVQLIHSEDVEFIDDEGDPDHKAKSVFEVIIFELDHFESEKIIEKIKEKAKLNGCDIEIKLYFGHHTNEEILAL